MDQTPGSDIAQGVVQDLSSINPIMALIKLLTSAMPAQVTGPAPLPPQQGTNPISGVPSGLKGAMLGGQQKPPLQY